MESSSKQKAGSRGDKCLARFTSSNGSVYGSLTLDIRKAGDYSQPIPAAVRVCHGGQKIFLRLGKSYTLQDWMNLCEYEKTGRRAQMADRIEMKGQMDKICQLVNHLIDTNAFSLRKLQDITRERWLKMKPSIPFGRDISKAKRKMARPVLQDAVGTSSVVSSKIWEQEFHSQTSTEILSSSGQRR